MNCISRHPVRFLTGVSQGAGHMATRCVGLDGHHDTVVIAMVDHEQQVLLKPKQIRIDQLQAWVERSLAPTDQVVWEAASNAWTLHDRLKPGVGKIIVTQAAEVKLIANAG
jgi:hypothetical protein